MARTGRPRKRDGAQGHWAYLQVMPLAWGVGEPIPPPPTRVDGTTLSARTLLMWDAFWLSAVSAAVDLQADGRQLRQMFLDLDELEDVRRRIQETGPFVTGSMGQIVRHPGFVREERLEARIRETEAKFGRTPADRERLGLVATGPQSSADELDRRLREPR